jgi:hypothetical protein
MAIKIHKCWKNATIKVGTKSQNVKSVKAVKVIKNTVNFTFMIFLLLPNYGLFLPIFTVYWGNHKNDIFNTNFKAVGKVYSVNTT